MPLKYSNDEMDCGYIQEAKCLKSIIRMQFPGMKALKRANPTAIENKDLILKLKNTDNLLKKCVTQNERDLLISNIFKDMKLEELIFLAKKKNGCAQYFLGLTTFQSKTSNCSPKGLKWLERAADKKNTNALAFLAKRNNDLIMYNQAARRGHVGAMIALHHHNKWNPNAIIEILMRAYDTGNRDDELFQNIGMINENWKDYGPALRWYSQIASPTRDLFIRTIMNNGPWDIC